MRRLAVPENRQAQRVPRAHSKAACPAVGMTNASRGKDSGRLASHCVQVNPARFNLLWRYTLSIVCHGRYLRTQTHTPLVRQVSRQCMFY